MTKIVCDHCGKSYNSVAGASPVPLLYGFRDSNHNYDFCSLTCMNEWLGERGYLQQIEMATTITNVLSPESVTLT